MNRQRIALGAIGVLLGLFGVFRLLTEIKVPQLEELAVWLAAAVILHDAIFSPILAGTGWAIARFVPRRARRFLQPGLVVAGLITVVALPMIYRRGTLPSQKGILRQNYTANLALALGIVLAVMLLAYAAQLLRDRSGAQPAQAERPLPGNGQRASATKDLPPEHQASSTE